MRELGGFVRSWDRYLLLIWRGVSLDYSWMRESYRRLDGYGSKLHREVV